MTRQERCRKWNAEHKEYLKLYRSTDHYKELKKTWKRDYYVRHKEDVLKKYAVRRIEHPEIELYRVLKKRSKNKNLDFSLDKNEFYSWYTNAAKRCTYCDLEDLSLDIPGFNGKMGLRFTIDRKDVSLPYTYDNMCLSCWRCNKLKSDYFTYTEFREIAQKHIKYKWQAMKRAS